MPNLITPPELADEIADKLGVYGACAVPFGSPCDGKCRPSFTSDLAERIRMATINEHMLATQGRFKSSATDKERGAFARGVRHGLNTGAASNEYRVLEIINEGWREDCRIRGENNEARKTE